MEDGIITVLELLLVTGTGSGAVIIFTIGQVSVFDQFIH